MSAELRILIAEDSEDDVFILQRALIRAGVTNPTYICRDGQEVINYLKGEGDYADRRKFAFPRMLILDLKMPLLSGFDVLRWLHGHPDCGVIPTIVLTSSSEDRDVIDAYRLGVNAYLVKPGNFDELTTLLKCVAEFWNRCKLPPLLSKC